MDERFAQVSDEIRLCYEAFGDPGDPAMLLVMGLGTQMLGWHEHFCAQLADNVERVIIGKRDTIELVMVALLVEGHVLFEDVPGTGKTFVARLLARWLH